MWLVQEPSETPPAASSSAGWPCAASSLQRAVGQAGRAPHGREAAVVAEREDDAVVERRPRGCARARSRGRASSPARTSITPQASAGTVFLTSPACSCVATRRHAGPRAVQLALDPQQLARERPQRRAALVGRGAGVRRHAVGGDRDPAAGLARRHDRAGRAAALEAQGSIGAVHGLERERRDVAALLVGHAVQLDAPTSLSAEALERGQRRRARRPSCRRRRGRARARPRRARGARAAVPRGTRCRGGRAAGRARRPRRASARPGAGRPGDGRSSTSAAGLAGPAREQPSRRRRGPRGRPSASRSRTAGAAARRRQGSAAVTRGSARRFRLRAAAAGGCRPAPAAARAPPRRPASPRAASRRRCGSRS